MALASSTDLPTKARTSLSGVHYLSQVLVAACLVPFASELALWVLIDSSVTAAADVCGATGDRESAAYAGKPWKPFNPKLNP